MKSIEYYLELNYPMMIKKDPEEGGYVVSFPDLPGCLTCGDTIEEALEQAGDAKRTWLQAALADGVYISDPDDNAKYSGQFNLRVPKTLHKLLSEHAKREGISMNQYCVYLLSRNDALRSSDTK